MLAFTQRQVAGSGERRRPEVVGPARDPVTARAFSSTTALCVLVTRPLGGSEAGFFYPLRRLDSAAFFLRVFIPPRSFRARTLSARVRVRIAPAAMRMSSCRYSCSLPAYSDAMTSICHAA